jgi:hypothetical protein
MRAHHSPLQFFGLIATASVLASGVYANAALAGTMASTTASNGAPASPMLVGRSSASETGTLSLVDGRRTAVDSNRTSRALRSFTTAATGRGLLNPTSVAPASSATPGQHLVQVTSPAAPAPASRAAATKPVAAAPPTSVQTARHPVATPPSVSRPTATHLVATSPSVTSPVATEPVATQSLQAQSGPPSVAPLRAAVPRPISQALSPARTVQTRLPVGGAAAATGGGEGSVASSVLAEFQALALALATVLLVRFSLDRAMWRSTLLASRLEHPG